MPARRHCDVLMVDTERCLRTHGGGLEGGGGAGGREGWEKESEREGERGERREGGEDGEGALTVALSAQISPMDLYYLEDQDLARQLVELGYRGSGETLKREEFDARKKAAEEAKASKYPPTHHQHSEGGGGGGVSLFP